MRVSRRTPAPTQTPLADDDVTTAEALEKLWADPPGLIGKLKAVQNDAIGKRILLLGFFLLLLGGSVDSVLMRLQLAFPENTFLSAKLYNELFTNHGSITMFLVILPIMEGFTILILPFLLGSREMPYPRLGVYSFFTFLFGALLYYSSTLVGAVPDAGWFAYVPLSGPEYSPGLAIDYWLLGLSVAEVGAIAAGVEIIIAILKTRAPGMTLCRMPLFAWTMLVTAFMILFAFVPLIVGSLLLELDRKFGTQFFNPEAGGSVMLWEHLFWIFGHPEVYIQFLPATGVVSMVLPVFSRRPIAGYTFIVASVVAVGFISFGLWAHHMFTTGLPAMTLIFFSAASMMIGIPTGMQIFAWLGTIWLGKRPVWKTPYLFVIGFLVVFVIGGISGIMVAAVPFDLQAHDSYFVVGHLHYVLIGGVVFPIFAAVYYWLPKFTGRLLDERLGKINFWLFFIGFNVTFFPMHIVGLLGMPRRVYTYKAGLGWDLYNLLSTIGVFIMLAGIAVFAFNFIRSLRKGQPAGPNPWGGDTLEWAVASPPPAYGFAVPPIVHSRHPLWEQDDLHAGDPRTVKLVRALAHYPLTWRAALITSTADARPEEVFRVAGPSIWPFIAAVGTVGIFIGELYDQRPLAILAALLVVASVVAWHWPHTPPNNEAEEEAFEREHGIPINTGGSQAVTRWGMGLSILLVGIALVSFLLTYFYIRIENPTWPPPNTSPPTLPLAGLAAVLMVLSGAPTLVALRGIQTGKTTQLRGALAVAFVVAVAAFGLQAFDLSRQPFSGTEHAYGSVFYSLSTFVLVIAFAGLVMNFFTQFWAWQGVYTRRRHIAISNLAAFWAALIVVWLIGFGVAYLTPYVT